MIGDLSNSPEPIQIKLFSPPTPQLAQPSSAHASPTRSARSPAWSMSRTASKTPSAVPQPTSRSIPVLAARLGFTPTEVAEDATSILDGVTVNDPLIANGRPYTIRVRLGDETRQSLDTIQNTVFNSQPAIPPPRLHRPRSPQLPPQNEIRRENLSASSSSPPASRAPTSAPPSSRSSSRRRHAPAQPVRIEYGGTYQEQQKSFSRSAPCAPARARP